MSEIQFSVLDQLDQLEEIVLEGSRIPFSGGRLVNEQDAVEIMDGVRASLPGQIAQADQLLQKKDEFISSARSQADEIVQKAQLQPKHDSRRRLGRPRQQGTSDLNPSALSLLWQHVEWLLLT